MFKNKYNLIILVLGLVFVLGGCLKKEIKPESVVEVDKKQEVKIEKKNDEKTVDKIDEIKQGEIDTSDWLTYRNEEYGLEFKYPKNWFVEDNAIYSFDPKTVTDDKAEGFKLDRVKIEFFSAQICDHNKLASPCFETMEEYVSKKQSGLIVYTSKNKINVDNVDGVFSEGKIDGVADVLALTSSVYFVDKNKGYLFSYYGDHSLVYRNIFNEIIKTFKFLK